MPKQVILITGTPCVGKTTAAHLLTERLNAEYINLTELATREKLTQGKDKKRNTTIINEKLMKNRLKQIIQNSSKTSIIIDGHYAPAVVPTSLTTHVFVLRRSPTELRKLMENSGYTNAKLWENLASEILDTCLVDALNTQKKAAICELDITGKNTEQTVKQILDMLHNPQKCHVGVVDWIGELERQGLLEEYLRI